jgi:hypothetical protein
VTLETARSQPAGNDDVQRLHGRGSVSPVHPSLLEGAHLQAQLIPAREAYARAKLPQRAAVRLICGRRFPRPVPHHLQPHHWSDEVDLWFARDRQELQQ